MGFNSKGTGQQKPPAFQRYVFLLRDPSPAQTKQVRSFIISPSFHPHHKTWIHGLPLAPTKYTKRAVPVARAVLKFNPHNLVTW